MREIMYITYNSVTLTCAQRVLQIKLSLNAKPGNIA